MTQLTKREHIAAMALQGFLSGKAMEQMSSLAKDFGETPTEALVSCVVLVTDALIAELEKEEA